MYQVIICTINSGRVRRLSFDNWDAAYRCSDSWSAKNVTRRTYAVSIEHVQQQPVFAKTAGRSR